MTGTGDRCSFLLPELLVVVLFWWWWATELDEVALQMGVPSGVWCEWIWVSEWQCMWQCQQQTGTQSTVLLLLY